MLQQDFHLAEGTYLLSHSVGRPLKSTDSFLNQHLLSPWKDSNAEPWGHWLEAIGRFRHALAELFKSEARLFCPQVNLSSGLTKLLQSREWPNGKAVILMSEIDFPSMGFAIQQSLGNNVEIRFIDRELDITDAAVWKRHIRKDVDLAFISHAYSNTGQRAPIEEIVPHCRQQGCLSVIDVAQSAGVLPLNLNELQPDFMLGSSVKWLCGGPGAAYLWVNHYQLQHCKPKDVGWFSHQNPFEFDIHNFDYNDTALRFWGGTPSVAPFVIAANSISYMTKLGDRLHNHNQALIDYTCEALGERFYSPLQQAKRSGTMIIKSDRDMTEQLELLANAGISVDARMHGLRVSPHIYNTREDMDKLIDTLNK